MRFAPFHEVLDCGFLVSVLALLEKRHRVWKMIWRVMSIHQCQSIAKHSVGCRFTHHHQGRHGIYVVAHLLHIAQTLLVAYPPLKGDVSGTLNIIVNLHIRSYLQIGCIQGLVGHLLEREQNIQLCQIDIFIVLRLLLFQSIQTMHVLLSIGGKIVQL